jgi:hypothetical protein
MKLQGGIRDNDRSVSLIGKHDGSFVTHDFLGDGTLLFIVGIIPQESKI